MRHCEEVFIMDNEYEESIEDNLNGIDKIVNVCNEESIHQEISQHIREFSTAWNCQESSSTPSLTSLESNTLELNRRVQNGEITPFEADLKKKSAVTPVGIFNPTTGLLDLEKYLRSQAEAASKKKKLEKPRDLKIKKKPENHILKKKRNHNRQNTSLISCKIPSSSNSVSTKKKSSDGEISKPAEHLCQVSGNDSGSEYLPSDEYDDSDGEYRNKRKLLKKHTTIDTSRKKRILDDGDEKLYRKRVKITNIYDENDLRTVDNLFKIPRSIWKRLFEYQKVSIRWLWELHGRGLGGLLSDEMGLGKTVQVIAFFAGLDCSELLSDGGRFRGLGPVLIVCPATLLEQWVKHFHDWWPVLRVVTLHQSGTYRGEPEELVESMKPGGILLTSYSGVLNHMELLIKFQWHYVVLDEGHKIRNPKAKVTKVVKKFSTPHRLLLTGSPMQNSLKELWSLFDFILPGKLGTLEAFIEHCATPITRGGYSNASALQEATALQVATMLKDAISPYMLRRTKNNIKHHISLPEKNEQVLFCSLTEEQTDLYKEYLHSDQVTSIIHDKTKGHITDGRNRAKLFVALTALRKICNHPDLYVYSKNYNESDEDIESDDVDLEKFGYWKRSGKMVVVRSLLKIWKRQNHRVLLFTQGRQMMHILEGLVQLEKYKYLRLDGSTLMSERQTIIQKFNEDPSYFVFISTTRVGGLGINLTGADRVIIYDPDWNPATDAQARERAWRIGQDKRVTIYRLITVGTIEEKIYHRQIFKLLLSNRILDDPRQRRLFQTSDLTELFNLNEPINGEITESDRLFANSKLNSNNFQDKAVRKLTKERKKRQITALFEGEEVSFLVGRRLGKSKKETSPVVDDDNYVLNKLFSKTTVSSALEHDRILLGAKVNISSATPMQRLAHDVAQESMDFVRQSRKWCWKPSWHNS